MLTAPTPVAPRVQLCRPQPLEGGGGGAVTRLRAKIKGTGNEEKLGLIWKYRKKYSARTNSRSRIFVLVVNLSALVDFNHLDIRIKCVYESRSVGRQSRP